MKVTAATLLTLLAAAPSAYAANTRRLGAADVSDIDNRRLSMDLIETAAVEPAAVEPAEWQGESKSGKGESKSGKGEEHDYYYYEGGESKSAKSGDQPTPPGMESKSAKSGGSGMMAATSDGPPPEAEAIIAKIMEMLGGLGVDIPDQASDVEPAFDGPIVSFIAEIIEEIIKELIGHGSKSGKGESKSAKRA